ncbi:hypothetical protein Tco_0273109 [Tanacetum coccineum]
MIVDDDEDDDDMKPFIWINQGKSQKGATSIQITDTRDADVDSSMHRSDPESEQSEQSSDNIPMQDEGHVSDLEDTDNAHIPKVSTTTWFKPIPEGERPATPEPEWTIPPNDFPEPENNWANTYATTYQVPTENKLQRKTYDIGSFIKWFCRRTGKKKLCKADLADVVSEHFDRDDNAGDDNEETKPDPEEIYNHRSLPLLNPVSPPCQNHSIQLSPPTSALQQAGFQFLRNGQGTLLCKSIQEPSPSLRPPGYISSGLYLVAIVASRAVDPVGSPSSTTIDQDEQSTSTSPTNQEIQSQVTHQGVEE